MTESSQPLDSQFGANSISLDLLQQRLHHRLETTGALDRLRAQLRQHVLNELRGAGARSCDDRARQYSTYDRALNAVIADFLRRHDHVYALSVFLSESSTDPDLFQASDLERLLCLPEKSVENENSSKSILTVVVELAARLKSNSLVSCAIQTDGTNDELEFSLRLIDQKYRRQSKDEDDAAQQCVEERISKQIREIEQRAAETLKQEIERIRITEIAAVRISESEKHQQDLDAVRQQFERQYHERLEQLRVKEQENNQILEKRKQAFESLEYDRRQQLLAEIETIKLRDVDLKRGVELEKRALQLERESIRKELEDAKRRADVFEKELERKAYSMELRSAEYDASHRYILDQDKIELEHVIKDYNDKRKWLEQEKESYQKCKLMLEETHEQLRLKEQEIQELLQIKSKLHEANTAVGQLQQKLDEVLQAKRDLEKDLTLKVKENEMFSSQLKSLEKQFQDERRNFESSLASIQSEHELAFQVYKSEFSKQQKNLQNQILVLSKELSERLDEEDKVRMRYEDEQLRSKSLWREVTGLKSYIDELQCQNKIRTKTTAGKFRTNYGRTATVFSKTHTSYLEFKQDQKTESVEKENLFSLHANKEEEDHRSNETPEKAKRKGSFLQSEVETDQIKVSKITEKDDTKRQESHESVTDLVKHDLISTEVDVTLRQLNASDVKDEAHDADKLVKVPDNLDLDSNQANTINDSSTTSNGILSTTIGPNPELISRDGANTETVKDLSNENTDLSTYLVTNAEEQSTNDETAQIAQMNFRMPPDSNTQNKTLDLANEFGSSKNREPNEIDQEKIEQIEDLKKKEDMEKKREEMILRAAQQRKERDERERRERFSNRRSNFTTYSNNATVSRAPPAKRFFNIGDENK